MTAEQHAKFARDLLDPAQFNDLGPTTHQIALAQAHALTALALQLTTETTWVRMPR